MWSFLKSKGLLFDGIVLITYVFILYNISHIVEFIQGFGAMLTPFVFGFVIAYLINPLISFIRRNYLKIVKKECPIWLGMLLAYLFLLFIILFLCLSIFPPVFESMNTLGQEIPNAIREGYAWIETEGLPRLSELTNNVVSIPSLENIFTMDIDNLMTKFSDWVLPIFEFTKNVTTFFVNSILGLLISIYMLMHKHIYKAQAKKLVLAITPKNISLKILDAARYVHNTFSRYIAARVVDSTIIGILCYIGCLILGFDNSMLIAVVVGVTNVIPYFGPFIGAIPCALVVLLQGPKEMIIFCIFILILQQFDGNILGPKLLGDSLGITSMWVLFAVVITTWIFGIVGMVIGVPLFTIFYMVIREGVYYLLNKKGYSCDTESYMTKNDYMTPIFTFKKKKK